MRLLAPSKPWQAVTSGLFGLAAKARMAGEWFRMAEQVDRLSGRSLAPVGDKVKSLNFRKDTSSGSASRAKKTETKRNKKRAGKSPTNTR